MCQGIHTKVRGQGGSEPRAKAGLPGCPDRDRASSLHPLQTHSRRVSLCSQARECMTSSFLSTCSTPGFAPTVDFCPAVPGSCLPRKYLLLVGSTKEIFWLRLADVLVPILQLFFCCKSHDLEAVQFGCLQLMLVLTALLHSNPSAALNLLWENGGFKKNLGSWGWVSEKGYIIPCWH